MVRPGDPLFHHERADALVALAAVLGGEDHDGLGDGGVGDEHFAAVEEVGAVALDGGGLHRGGVGTAAGFGEGESGHALTGGQGGQQALFLGVAAELVDGGHAEAEVGQPADGGRGVAPGHFFRRRWRPGGSRPGRCRRTWYRRPGRVMPRSAKPRQASHWNSPRWSASRAWGASSRSTNSRRVVWSICSASSSIKSGICVASGWGVGIVGWRISFAEKRPG